MKKFVICAVFVIILMLTTSISVFAVNENEWNDSADNATSITVNSTVYGNLSNSNDVDWYKFTVNEDGFFNVTFNHELIDDGSAYWQIRFYDSTGVNFIDGNSAYFSVSGNRNMTTNTFGVKAGTYYIRICDYYHSDIEYNFEVNFTASSNWETENNNSKNTADEITANETYNGSFSTNGDVDWYKVTIPSDGYLYVDFQHELIDDGSTYWQIRFYDSTGVNFIDGNSDYFSVSGNRNMITNTFGVSAGTYYIKLNDYYYSGKNYQLCVKFTEDANWETENNNSKESADLISVNQTYNGSFSTDGDVDWYKFNITESGYFVVDFQHVLIDSGSTYWQMRLYDSTGVNYIDGNSDYFGVAGNDNLTTTTFAVSPGTYYIYLSDYYYSGVNYTINVKFVSDPNWEKENNNSKDNASSMNVNSSINGSLSTDGDVDWYKFTVESECEIAIVLNHTMLNSNSVYWTINVYDSSAVTKIFSLDCRGGDTSSSSEYVSIPSGTYYIRITDYYYSGINYKLTVLEKHDCTGSFEITSDPTCTEPGVKEKNCATCGQLMETQEIPATGHTCDSWVIDKAPTCTMQGKKHDTCEVCAETVIENIPMINHTVGEWDVTDEPTCHKEGMQTRACSECDYVETEILSALTHVFGEWYVATETSCYYSGLEERVCGLCGDKESLTIDQLTHEYGEWEVVSGSKLIPPIVKEKTCVHCADVQSTEDWSYVWVTIIAVVALIGILIGVINYIRAFKKK